MSHLISLESVDKEGTLRETAEAAGANRRDFLRKGAVTGGGFVAAGVLFNGFMSPAEAAISTRNKSAKNDVKILQYAMTLELLEADFYRQALAGGALKDPVVVQFATVTAEHEADHVSYLRKALGKSAVKGLEFDFKTAVTNEAAFKATAQVLEDTGVSAYAGQGPNIAQAAVVKAALSIHSVEARHAAWIRYINGGGAPGARSSAYPAPKTFDAPASEKKVLAAAGGFIK